MNYQAHYEALISKYGTWEKPSGVYTERHRKLPGCMGGKYVKGNAFYMDAKAHLTAHLILIKIYRYDPKLVAAAVLMSGGNTSKRYRKLKETWSNILRNKMTGDTNPSKLESVKQKNREAALLRCADPAYRKKLSDAQLRSYALDNGRKEKLSLNTSARNEQTRRKMSAAKLGKPQSRETVEKRAASLRGRKYTPERLAACILRANNPEAIAKIRAKITGQKRTERTKKNISEAIRLHWVKRKASIGLTL